MEILNFGRTRNSSELEDFTIASLIIGLAFSIALSAYTNQLYGPKFLLLYLPAGMLSGVSAFALHELAHRQMAIRYGFHARFRMWPFGVLFALVTSFFGFIFAAPGATEVYNVTSPELYGKISAAGPITNTILGLFFFSISIFVGGTAGFVLTIAGSVNIALAFFNLLPIPPLDGYKVFKWDTTIYLLMFVFAILLLIVLDRGFF